MKKEYKQPELYIENVMVEQGIAMSQVLLFGNDSTSGFGLGEETNYGEGDFAW